MRPWWEVGGSTVGRVIIGLQGEHEERNGDYADKLGKYSWKRKAATKHILEGFVACLF